MDKFRTFSSSVNIYIKVCGQTRPQCATELAASVKLPFASSFFSVPFLFYISLVCSLSIVTLFIYLPSVIFIHTVTSASYAPTFLFFVLSSPPLPGPVSNGVTEISIIPTLPRPGTAGAASPGLPPQVTGRTGSESRPESVFRVRPLRGISLLLLSRCIFCRLVKLSSA